MSAISALPADIVAWLSSQEELSGIRFMTEYPSVKKEIPLKKAIVAVGLEEVKIVDSFTDDGTGTLVENEYCRAATMKVKLAIHIPFSEGGATCHNVFADVVDCLTFASDLNIIESGCADVVADRDTDAFVLDAWISISSDFCPAVSSSLNFQSFMNKELLCGSHITDAAIHVTQTDKNLWNAPFLVSSYLGTGETTRTVTLDFTPKAVIVFREAMAFLTPVSSGSSNYYAQAGVAFMQNEYIAFGSLGLEIVSNGFRLYQGETHEITNVSANLNGIGQHYGFIAFR